MSVPGISLVADDGAPPSFPVETEQRLSRSLLFRLQRAFFHRRGIEAWRAPIVPHYVTNNPRLARAYAEVFLGWLRDRAAGPSDDPRPLTILELGAGCGRFGYLFLRALDDLHRRSSVSHVRFRYVMTDFTEANVRFWRAHEALRPFVDRGLLDFAVFDAEADATLDLLGSGERLAPGSLAGPLGVVANYVLDGLSQDAFTVEGGRLSECLVSLSAGAPVEDLEDPDLLDRLQIAYHRRPAPPDYYGEPALDALLRGYEATHEGQTILFPHAAVRCLSRLADLSRAGLFLLSGDRGSIDPGGVGIAGDPSLTMHGSFSVDVNYHAVAGYVRGRGGTVLDPGCTHVHLGSYGFLLGPRHDGAASGPDPAAFPETTLAYHQAISRGGPDDFFVTRAGLQQLYADLGLPQILAVIRLSQHDPRILRDCLPALSAQAELCTDALKREVVRAVTRAFEEHYFMGEDEDLAFEFALVTQRYGAHREALSLYAASARRVGPSAQTTWNQGLCHYALGEIEPALRCFADAARLDPAFFPASAIQPARPRST